MELKLKRWIKDSLFNSFPFNITFLWNLADELIYSI